MLVFWVLLFHFVQCNPSASWSRQQEGPGSIFREFLFKNITKTVSSPDPVTWEKFTLPSGCL